MSGKNRELVFNQFLRPVKGIGLPVNFDISRAPLYESEIAFDRARNKFLFSIEKTPGEEDYEWVTISRSKEVVNIFEDYEIDADDYVIVADASNGSLTIKLPDVKEAEFNEYYIKRVNCCTNNVDVVSDGVLIDAITNIKTLDPYQTLHLISDGEKWITL